MSLFAILGATVVATEENFSKFEKIICKEKFRKALILLAFRNFLGGDKEARTPDLLNAIQREDVGITGFFGCLVATW